MRKYKRFLLILLTCIFMAQGVLVKGAAGEGQQQNIILLIDNSGSMRQTDPGKLSVAAASMLIDTVQEGTNVNVIGFGDKVQSPHKLEEKVDRDTLKSELSSMKFDNNYTNLKEGLQEALNQLYKVQGEKTVIVLSDGKEDPAGGLTEEHKKELESLMKMANSSNVKISSIGLSKAADEKMLGKLASETGGGYFYCSNPSELLDVFSRTVENLSSFCTVEKYTTDMKSEKKMKFSSYIEEVVVKVVSCENRTPQVEVTQDGKSVPADKSGDAYRIYRIKNDGDSEITMTSRNQDKNLVMVEVRSKGKISVNSSRSSFTIPAGVPLEVEAVLEMDKKIEGLHMNKVEDGRKESLTQEGDKFRFTLKNQQAGLHSILIEAWDGDNRMIAVKNMSVSVTSDPPFYYASPLPEKVNAGEPFKVQLKQLGGAKVDSPSGQVVIDYGDKREQVPLNFENGTLNAQVTLDRCGDFSITACVSGISSNENFSYYLPGRKIKVVEMPFLQLDGSKCRKKFKAGTVATLEMDVLKNSLRDNVNMEVLDSKGKKVGEFQAGPNTKGKIAVQLKGLDKGRNLKFTLKAKGGTKAQGDVKVTEQISTHMKVVTGFQYWLPWIATGALIIVLMTGIFLGAQFIWDRNIKNCSINKEIHYQTSVGGPSRVVNATLTCDNDMQYLNLIGSGNNLSIESNGEARNAIGYLELLGHTGNKLLLALNWLRKGEGIFTVEYYPQMEQDLRNKDGEPAGDGTIYENGVETTVKRGRNTIKIYFS